MLIEVDLAGARAVKDAMPEALSVFLAPPSWALRSGWSAGGPKPGGDGAATGHRGGRTGRSGRVPTSSSSTTGGIRVRWKLISLLVGTRPSRRDARSRSRTAPEPIARRSSVTTTADHYDPARRGDRLRHPARDHQPAHRRAAQTGCPANTPWSSTPPSGRARSTTTTTSSATGSWSTSAPGGARPAGEKPLSIALREIHGDLRAHRGRVTAQCRGNGTRVTT